MSVFANNIPLFAKAMASNPSSTFTDGYGRPVPNNAETRQAFIDVLDGKNLEQAQSVFKRYNNRGTSQGGRTPARAKHTRGGVPVEE